MRRITGECEYRFGKELPELSVAGAPKTEIAARLRTLADKMDDISAAMDYYGGFAEWAQHGREIAGAGNIARQWAAEIEASNDLEGI